MSGSSYMGDAADLADVMPDYTEFDEVRDAILAHPFYGPALRRLDYLHRIGKATPENIAEMNSISLMIFGS